MSLYHCRYGLALVFAITLVSTLPAVSQQHGQHGQHGSQAAPADKPGYSEGDQQALPLLTALPPSGKSREAGSDGAYIMESTQTQSDLAIRCAQATRGLIVLDRATWEMCGEKPNGLPEAIVPEQVATQHKGSDGHGQSPGSKAYHQDSKDHQGMQEHRKMQGHQGQPKTPGKMDGHMKGKAGKPGAMPAPNHQPAPGKQHGKDDKHGMQRLDRKMSR